MGSVKVKEINLERGGPIVDVALRNLVNQLSTCKAQGYKAVVLIHGYGSSGTGGAIKVAVTHKLRERSLSGIVRDTCKGEEWMEKKNEFVNICPQLRDFGTRISGNFGITVVLLK